MNSYSQAGQDRFVWEILDHKPHGTFLDIGCHDGHTHSNTLGLEQMGWQGLLVDIQRPPALAARLSDVVIADTLNMDWPRTLARYFHGKQEIDYLSLDVDEATTETLILILKAPVRYRVITVEHDQYRLGPANRRKQLEALAKADYDLMCSNVCIGPGEWGAGGPFEDWWVDHELMTEEACRRFMSSSELGIKIVPPL